MKSSKRPLMTAFFDFIAGIYFAFAAAEQTEMLPKILYSIAAAGLLIGGIGLFCTDNKKRKTRYYDGRSHENIRVNQE